jgi:hypothetical protein
VSKPIIVVRWTWNHHRIVKTKKQAMRVCKVWKWWYERKGWSVRTAPGGNGYIAFAPDYMIVDWGKYSQDAKVHSIVIHSYDAETKKRIYPEPPPLRSELPEKMKPELTFPKAKRAGAPRRPKWG